MAAEDASVVDTAIPFVYPTHLISIDDVRKYVARETQKQRLTVLRAQSKIIQLYAFQNAFAPPNSLPPELLRQIFPTSTTPQDAMPILFVLPMSANSGEPLP